MQRITQPSSKNPTTESTKWLDYIEDDSVKIVIPVGPRFQANLPDWTGPPKKDIIGDKDLYETKSEDSKWLGTQIWPIKNEATKGTGAVGTLRVEAAKVAPPEADRKETNVGIGKGRSELCNCEWPGSVKCVRRHVTEKRIKLQAELGPVFWDWGFDGMGEEISNQWTLQEQHMFESIVKMNPLSQGKSFLKPALVALPCHDRHSILSYYFNVYLPRRIRKEIGSGCDTADTDDEETSATITSGTSPRKKRQRIM